MAGVRQHFIPRMLLRQFADSKEQVRALRRDGTFVAAIGNVALEKEFFGAPGPGTADEAITEEENRIEPMLRAACGSPEGPFDSFAAAALITHFTLRLRSLRTFMGQVGHAALDAAGRRFSSPDDVRRMVQQEVRSNSRWVADELNKTLRKEYGAAALKRLQRNKQQYAAVLREANKRTEQLLEGLDGAAIARDAGFLVGWRGQQPNLDEAAVTLGSVHASDDFLVAHPSTTDIERLAGEFGKARGASIDALDDVN